MNIVTDREYMIFKSEYQNRVFYKIGISKKDQSGNYINGYINCGFRKDINLDNKTKIKIKKAWLDFYLKDKITVPSIFIYEFEIISQEQKKEDPFEEFSNEVVLTELDLPF